MKLTTKNLVLILVVLLSAFAIVQLTKRGNKSESLRSELVSFDTAKVTKIEIRSPEGEVMLDKKDGQWTVLLATGEIKGTREGAAASLLTSLQTIEPGRLAARKEEKWKDYAVDSTGTRVEVFEGDQRVTDIVIGRFGVEGQRSFYSFVRLTGENEVYVADGFMGMSIGKKPADFRANTLLRLKKDSLARVQFNYPDSSFTLTKGEKWYLEDQLVDSTSMVGYLNGLSYLTSTEFYDEDLRVAPTHSVTYSFTNGDQVTIEGYSQPDGMVIKSSENQQELFLDLKITEKVFKGEKAFLPTSN